MMQEFFEEYKGMLIRFYDTFSFAPLPGIVQSSTQKGYSTSVGDAGQCELVAAIERHPTSGIEISFSWNDPEGVCTRLAYHAPKSSEDLEFLFSALQERVDGVYTESITIYQNDQAVTAMHRVGDCAWVSCKAVDLEDREASPEEFKRARFIFLKAAAEINWKIKEILGTDDKSIPLIKQGGKPILLVAAE